MAIAREFPKGAKIEGLRLISDNGLQPIETSFMRNIPTLCIEQILTSYDNPKGNADTERVMRTIKEEVIWLNEFSSLQEAKERISKWIEVDSDKLYVQSEQGYMSSEEFEELYYKELLKKAA